MPSGLRQDSDAWIRRYEDAKQMADDALAQIQDRNVRFPTGGGEASRLTASARRKLGALGTALDTLLTMLDGPQCADITENEKNRRRDLVAVLKTRKEQMLNQLKREGHASNRDTLLSTTDRGKESARETAHTAALDNQGIILLQQQMMREQDTELEELERTVTSTKHIALTVNEELDLHRRLLDDLDEDVEVSHSRLKAAQKKLKIVMKRSGNCKSMCFTILLMVVLAVVLVIAFKLVRLF